MSKRGYGSGALYEKDGVWYGRWHTASGTRPHRRVGLARKPGSRDGFTRSQAERELRRLMDADEVVRSKDRAAPTFAELGAISKRGFKASGASAQRSRLSSPTYGFISLRGLASSAWTRSMRPRSKHS